MDAVAAILFGLLITFTCGDTLRRAVSAVRQDTCRIPWRRLLVGLLGFGIGVALLIAGALRNTGA